MHYLCFDSAKNILFSSAGRFISHNAPVHPRRRLDSAVLLLGYSGEYPISQEGREYILSKGCFQILFPKHEHYGTTGASVGQSHFWCHFYLPEGYFIKEADSYEELCKEGLCVLPEFARLDDVEKYFVLFCQMIDEAEKSKKESCFRNVVCDAYIKILLCSISACCQKMFDREKDEKEKALTVRACEWLKLNACEGIKARDAACALGYSADYLTQLIKANTGLTLCSYLNSVKISEAKRLLLNSDMKVAEIAYAVGFSDEKYFMRVFKKSESVTPAQYRKAHFRVHFNR